jgi:hypothetical protein
VEGGIAESVYKEGWLGTLMSHLPISVLTNRRNQQNQFSETNNPTNHSSWLHGTLCLFHFANICLASVLDARALRVSSPRAAGPIVCSLGLGRDFDNSELNPLQEFDCPGTGNQTVE